MIEITTRNGMRADRLTQILAWLEDNAPDEVYRYVGADLDSVRPADWEREREANAPEAKVGARLRSQVFVLSNQTLADQLLTAFPGRDLALGELVEPVALDTNRHEVREAAPAL